MKLLKTGNGEPTEYNIRQLRNDNPNVSYPKEPDPDTLAEYGVFPFTEEPIDGGARKGFIETSDGWIMEWIAPDPAKVLQAKREAASMSRRKFAIAAARATYITNKEATQWVAGNEIPAAVLAVIEALPEEMRLEAEIDVLTQSTIRRTAALMPGIAAAFGADEAALDALFGIEP